MKTMLTVDKSQPPCPTCGTIWATKIGPKGAAVWVCRACSQVRSMPCPWCDGTQTMEQCDNGIAWDEPCRFCDGTGIATAAGVALYRSEVGPLLDDDEE